MLDTKTKILDAAEKLFAESGFASTSLRDITAAASVNLASANYHFGSKIELLSAVLARRFTPLNAERLERLAELEESAMGAPVPVEDVLRAFIAPIFRRLHGSEVGWAKFIQLVGRTHSDTNPEIHACFFAQFQETAERFIAALGRALPELPPALLGYRTHFVVGAMAHTFAFCEGAGLPFIETLPNPDDVLDYLVDFAAAGLHAPVSALPGVPEVVS